MSDRKVFPKRKATVSMDKRPKIEVIQKIHRKVMLYKDHQDVARVTAFDAVYINS